MVVVHNASDPWWRITLDALTGIGTFGAFVTGLILLIRELLKRRNDVLIDMRSVLERLLATFETDDEQSAWKGLQQLARLEKRRRLPKPLRMPLLEVRAAVLAAIVHKAPKEPRPATPAGTFMVMDNGDQVPFLPWKDWDEAMQRHRDARDRVQKSCDGAIDVINQIEARLLH